MKTNIFRLPCIRLAKQTQNQPLISHNIVFCLSVCTLLSVNCDKWKSRKCDRWTALLQDDYFRPGLTKTMRHQGAQHSIGTTTPLYTFLYYPFDDERDFSKRGNATRFYIFFWSSCRSSYIVFVACFIAHSTRNTGQFELKRNIVRGNHTKVTYRRFSERSDQLTIYTEIYALWLMNWKSQYTYCCGNVILFRKQVKDLNSHFTAENSSNLQNFTQKSILRENRPGIESTTFVYVICYCSRFEVDSAIKLVGFLMLYKQFLVSRL